MKIVILAGDKRSSDIVYNALSDHFDVEKIIFERGGSRKTFLKRRIKKLGIFKVTGQILFKIFIVSRLEKKSQDRISEIIESYGLSDSRQYRENESDKCLFVKTVNDEETVRILQEIRPDVVIVNGTGIIKKKVLDCCDAVFINMHVGITPKYRGCHGAYWALVNHDEEHCGVTIHLVDEGIDTGNIIYQATIRPTDRDNFVTYPFLQLAEGIALEIKALHDFEHNSLRAGKNDLESHLWTHPTLFEYLRNGVK